MINTVRLRCMLGWLGILLPWIVVILMLAFPSSISATYYGASATYEIFSNNTIVPFMIILGSAGFLLISYKGYDVQDDIVNTIAGIAGLLICLFPCMIGIDAQTRVGTFQVAIKYSAIVHNVSAFIFFGLLSYNSLFLFTKTSGNMTDNKKKRNVIYRICGIGMMASFLLFLLPDFYIKVWLIETIALFFFGISFLTKADCYPWLFCDKH